SSEDDDDDDEEEASKEDEEEEEGHLVLANSAALPIIDPVPSTRLYRAQKIVKLQPPMAASTKALIVEYASAPTPLSPPPSLLSPWSSPFPQIPSPPLLILSLPLPLPSSPTHTSPTYANVPLGYIAAMIQSIATLPSPVPSPPLFEVGESSTAATARQTGHTLAHRVDYGFVDTVDASIRASESRVMTAMEEVNERVTNLATTQRQDAHELHIRDEDAQDDQALLRAQISLLTRDRRYFRSMASSYL
ncbi:hypothetical protein Tco_1232069, partial [Tanacetum coccineum]